MKILQVRFKNLNSLVGEWGIDLTHPAYASDGIFAITGPTGAGKSTILDAICLALFGRTPRLSRISDSTNEIMSRQTGECFAEVTFETSAGRFRCHWSQHRSRKRPEGKLQNPKHEISNADSGEIGETKIRGVANQIQSVTGMDFDRFTRSMLLAQGGFAAFLQAAPDERAPILEQLTGTEIYGEISQHVHARLRDARDQLGLLQAEFDGLVVLEPDQEIELREELQSKLEEQDKSLAQKKTTSDAIAWHLAIQSLQRELDTMSVDADRLRLELETFATKRDVLANAVRAANLEAEFATLESLRNQQREDHAALKTEEAELPPMQTRVNAHEESVRSAERKTHELKEQWQVLKPLLQSVRALDQSLNDKKQEIATLEASCGTEAAKIESDRRRRDLVEEKIADVVTEIANIQRYLSAHAHDEWLVGHLAGVEIQLDSLKKKQQEIAQREIEIHSAEQSLADAEKALQDGRVRCGERQKVLSEAVSRHRVALEGMTQLLGERRLQEYRTEKETLLRERAFLSRIAELEEHRRRLEDGKPCPLCGAEEHPFARGNVPDADATDRKVASLTELIQKAEGQEVTIAAMDQAITAARTALVDAQRQELLASTELATARQSLIGLRDRVEILKSESGAMHQGIVSQLTPLGISEETAFDAASLLASLRARLEDWRLQRKRNEDAEKRMSGLTSDLQRLEGILETQQSALARNQERLKSLHAEYELHRVERIRLFGDRCPDIEEARSIQAIDGAEAADRQARENHQKQLDVWNAAMARIEALQKRVAQRESEQKQRESQWVQSLKDAGFADERTFREACLPASQRDALSAQAKELDDRFANLRVMQQDRQTRLIEQRAKGVTDEPLEVLEPKLQELDSHLLALAESIAGLKHRIGENDQAKTKVAQRQSAIESQRRECRRWENLHELIGSADGKKYRNFAQGLTFERVVIHANRQLRKMSDRYLLVRDPDQPLELSVVDQYQAGERRSTKNLSGGESFIVSLALALGLSQMASRKVRVDSLFLDEGFGTLDEEALETALDTLAGLRRDGKLIGVISHVPFLKDRIDLQIRIEPMQGGRSRILGPGCRKK